MHRITPLFVLAAIVSPALLISQTPGPKQVLQSYDLVLSDGRHVPAEIGQLSLLENRSVPGSDTIRVAYVRLQSTSQSPGNPIVFLPGSPGGASGTQTLRAASLYPFFERLRAQGDVIVLDYRGSGLSTPLLSCPSAAGFPTDVFSSRDRAMEIFVEQARTCKAATEAAGRDITGYNWAEIATDVDALRRALGAPRIDIVGFSSGTHAALATIRRYGNGIGRVVFLGTEGPNDTRKLPLTADRQISAIGALIDADSAARKTYAGFPAMVDRVLKRLDEKPLIIRMPVAGTADTVEGKVGRFALEFITAKSLSGPDAFATLPALYSSLDRGDARGITRVLRGFASRPPASPLSYVLDAASGATQPRWARIRAEEERSLLGRALNFPFPEITGAWGVRDLGEGFRAPVVSRTPALFVTGEIDGNTPYDQAEAVRKGFANSTHLRIARGGHTSTMTVPEATEAIADFLAGKQVSARKSSAPVIRFPVQ